MTCKKLFKQQLKNIQKKLSRLSFSTGVIVLSLCFLFYFLSFAQFTLPISTSLKGVLWGVFFGLAKACQYTGLAILGKEGYKRLKQYLKILKTK